ncbi:MAG TPA: phosphonate ABC transporter, permease protein PhnE [Candidatus Thermoplasmatota archaeon]|nr:phosphonate ABC transporter, permease protein PhnE [Candidatus Thermoplasmatota archaeon]
MKRSVQPATLIALGVLSVLLILALADLGFFESGRMTKGFRNVGIFARDLVPPDLDPALLRTLVVSLAETVEMAFAGTLLGAAAGLPLSVLAARPLSGAGVARVTRVLLAFVRTVPSLLWALVFVILFGLGPVAGVLGIAVYTLGYIGKLYYEAFEGLDPDVLEAVRATGAGRVQLVRHAALPEAANALVSNLLYAFEYNVRASSILGFVGAGGIGFYLLRYLQLFEYQRLTTAILMLLVLVVGIDAASRRFRKRFVLHPAAGFDG